MSMHIASENTDPNKLAPRKSGRAAIISAMLLSLLGSAGTRYWADQKREVAIPLKGSDASASSLGSMSSFSLGLLLGGLRGPLVMILWTESETQKSEKNLEGVDTQIEWIRLLQPEFDTVHIFEIWNKAYNISVQMASLANKYDVILGALDYAYKVDRAKPDDINIVAAIGQLYFDKLGQSSEKTYYRRRVRQETVQHATNQKLRQKDPGWRRVQLDPILDASFNVLPELLKPAKGQQRPANLPAEEEWDDGSDLQYLPKFAPYPDGVSSFGLAYNYYKRAEVLQNVAKQHHDQLSDLVIDSRPALSLKFWGEEELEQGHRRELQAFDLPMPDSVDDLLGLTAPIPVTQTPKDPAALSLAANAFDRAGKVLAGSLEEYKRHILHFPEKDLQYQSYMGEIRIEIPLAGGDYEYTMATLDPDHRADHLAKATAYYHQCERLSYVQLLRYYITPDFTQQVLPPGYKITRGNDQKTLEDLSDQQLHDAVTQADALKRQSKNQYVDTDRYEFDRFINRCVIRTQAISRQLGTGAPNPRKIRL